jgi:hypothetical protein
MMVVVVVVMMMIIIKALSITTTIKNLEGNREVSKKV